MTAKRAYAIGRASLARYIAAFQSGVLPSVYAAESAQAAEEERPTATKRSRRIPVNGSADTAAAEGAGASG